MPESENALLESANQSQAALPGERVIVRLADKYYELRYEWGDFALAAGHIGKPLIGPGSEWFWGTSGTNGSAGMPPDYQLLVLVFVGILHCDPTLTLPKVADKLTHAHTPALDGPVARALRRDMGSSAGDSIESGTGKVYPADTGSSSVSPAAEKGGVAPPPFSNSTQAA